MRKALCIAALVLAPSLAQTEDTRAPPPSPPRPSQNRPPPPAVSCVGRWQGWGRGQGPAWSIDLNITSADARCGTIEYPSLGCGGYLIECVVRDGRVHAVEVYTHNPGTCAPAGTIDGECTATSMEWVWRGFEIVRTRLHRI